MSQPQISQTMFYIEGQTTAVLVTRRGNKQRSSHPRFMTAVGALIWCRKHRAGFVYMPSVPNN